MAAAAGVAWTACAAEPPVEAGPGHGAWTETAAEKNERMAWWRAARFGIFIHWGVYSRLEGKWDGKEVPGVGEWIMEHGKIPASDYAREGKKFDPKEYDPQAWAELFAAAGAKYVVITSRHHDGFCLWESGARVPLLWDDGRGRDLLTPLKKAVESKGLKFGLYYSILDWTHPDYPGRRAWNDLWPGRTPDPEKFERYVGMQLAELSAAYDPAVLWFDGEWEDAWTREQGLRTGALVREIAPRAIVNNRFAKGRRGMSGMHAATGADEGDFGTPEQEVPRRAMVDVDWETCLTMNDTWGFKASDTNFKTTRELIRTLVDVASKGGNLLLNVGPDGQGRIPEASVQRLRGMGEWLAVNGEAIYGTRAGPLARLPYGRTTQRQGVVYVHVFDWPTDGKLALTGLKNEVKRVRMVGSPDAPVSVHVTEECVWLHVPSQPPDADATVLAVEIVGAPEVVEAPKARPADGSIVLAAEDAGLSGDQIDLERKDGDRDNIGYWTDATASAAWTAQVDQAGEYEVWLVMACQPGSAGDEFVVEVGEQRLRGTVASTGSWEDFEPRAVGTATLGAGKVTVKVRAANPQGRLKHALMNLQEVRLTPVKR